MATVASKLLMCVCAGTTGAAVVPAAKAVRHQLSPKRTVARPAVQRVAAAPPVIAAAAVPCLPDVAGSASGIDGLALTLPGIETPLPGTAGPSRLSVPGEVGELLSGAGGGGFAGGGGGGGGLVPPGTPPVAGPPSSSNAPEPAAWALMIIGFGALGGAMRWARRPAIA